MNTVVTINIPNLYDLIVTLDPMLMAEHIDIITEGDQNYTLSGNTMTISADREEEMREYLDGLQMIYKLKEVG